MMEGWSQGAVVSAATEAGSAAAAARMGLPPQQAGAIRLAAGAELARRARGGMIARRGPAPVVLGGEARPRVIAGLMEDPVARGMLWFLIAGLGMLSLPWRPRQRPLAPEPVPEQEPEPEDPADLLEKAYAEFAETIGRAREINEIIATARLELPFEPPFRPLVEDLIDYADEKLGHGGRLVPAHRLTDPAFGLPPTALAVMNSGSADHVEAWRREMIEKKKLRAPRRAMLLRLHREGLEILKRHPLPGLGQCEPGPPRGIWPPPEPELDPEPKAKAAAGRKLSAAATLTPHS